jgi:hypothetical protein
VAQVASAPAAADVAVSQCVLDPADDRSAVVTGTIVNHDVQKDDYTIAVTILHGTRTVGSAFDVDGSVPVGQTSTWSTVGAVAPGTGSGLTCAVASVNRLPS